MSDEYKKRYVIIVLSTVAPIMGLPDKHEITTLGPSELIKGGKWSVQTLVSQTRTIDRYFINYHASYYWSK